MGRRVSGDERKWENAWNAGCIERRSNAKFGRYSHVLKLSGDSANAFSPFSQSGIVRMGYAYRNIERHLDSFIFSRRLSCTQIRKALGAPARQPSGSIRSGIDANEHHFATCSSCSWPGTATSTLPWNAVPKLGFWRCSKVGTCEKSSGGAQFFHHASSTFSDSVGHRRDGIFRGDERTSRALTGKNAGMYNLARNPVR